jgi:hypothetical protein
MEFQFRDGAPGTQLGIEGYDRLREQAQVICTHERQRIELANQAPLAAKQAEYSAEYRRYEELEQRIYKAGPPHEDRLRRRRIAYCWTVAIVLIVAGFALTVLTLEPYALGLKGLFYCLGIAIAVPYLVENMLHRHASEKLVRVLVTIASIVALMSLMILAVIRGELLARHTQEDSPAVTIEGEEPQATTQTKPSFYDETVQLLEIVMVLLAFSMEVGAGIAMHEAERVSANRGESCDLLEGARKGSEARLSLLVKEIITLQSEPAEFEKQFWRDFHWAMLRRSMASARKVFVIGTLLALLLVPSAIHAQQPLELVVLLDLSRSVSVSGPDRQTEFQKNITAVGQLLKQVPAGAHVTIVGITDNSFAQPYVLLSASVAPEQGYFGEKLATARTQLDLAWKRRSRDLAPSFNRTDLFGAFLVASQIFEKAGSARHHVLVVFSDMRQETKEISFGGKRGPCGPNIFHKIKDGKLAANLKDSNIYVLGTESTATKSQEWLCIHDFWVQYFLESGSTLRSYSVLRTTEPPL